MIKNKSDSDTKILFVCLGNICRSPSAEAVFRKRARENGLRVHTDSAGTGGWHRGSAPDLRMREAGERRGYDFSGLRARQVCAEDFDKFDLILAMDAQNLADLQAQSPANLQYKLRRFLEYAPHLFIDDVPDPYYGGSEGFAMVMDLIEVASDGLITHLKSP